MAEIRTLRGVSIGSLVPGFALCIAHGVLSRDTVPAVGLAPLAVSAAVGIFFLAAGPRQQHAHSDPDHPPDLEDTPEDEDHEARGAVVRFLTHRIVVFFADSILAAALMVVLVFTWVRAGDTYRSDMAMLAGYATLPLLVNFLIHLYLAVREFVIGLGIDGLFRYAAWRAVPADCPQCGFRLRPDSLPTVPWYQSVSAPKVSFPSMSGFTVPSLPRPSLPNIQFPAFRPSSTGAGKAPAWIRSRHQDASLFASNEEPEERDSLLRYQDDGEERQVDDTPPASTTGVEGEDIVVVGKDKKRI
ncbi:hypothetical protein B0T25DRAFT_472356 [Lasiosphaeria hispida]|uniref:Uncharacterized protein n=1 Tax=Lasiosphaeria hispida TaxID=260671 RepID=A0AAJ0HQK9_9PEZI|nr:hypothetical protein B0T25DRAFT_472356 [Lasiosphaeria hispida]